MLLTIGFLGSLLWTVDDQPRLTLSASSLRPFVGQEVLVTLDIAWPRMTVESSGQQHQDMPRIVIPWLEADLDWAEDLKRWKARYAKKADSPPLLVQQLATPIYPERIALADGEDGRWDHYRLTWRLVAPPVDDINEGRLRLAPVRLSWKNLALASAPVEMRLRPVPPDLTVSSGIQLGVGDFTIRASVEPVQVSLGESLRLTLRVTGRGPLWKLRQPSPRELAAALPPRDFAVEPDGEEWMPDQRERRFHYRLTPRSGGLSELPRIPYACFDPDSEAWRHRSTAPAPLIVRSPKPPPDLMPSKPIPGPVPTRLRFDLLEDSDLTAPPVTWPTWLSWVAWLLPPVAWFLLWLNARNHAQRLQSQGRSAAARRALTLLRNEAEQEPSQLAQIMLDYLRLRFGVNVSEPSAEEIQRHLLQTGVPSETAEAAARWWQSTTMARFMQPCQAEQDSRETFAQLRKQASQLIGLLEKDCP
jgi:hypothetical protein